MLLPLHDFLRNPAKPFAAELETLENTDMSYSKFTIAAINAYGSYLSHEKEKQEFLRQVLETIDNAIRSNPGIGLAGLLQQSSAQKGQEMSKTDAEESGKIADDFLENFI